MKRIMIFGGSGSGKSTLARQIGDITGLPVVHIDPIYWLPGWQPRPRDQVAAMIRAAADQPEWVFEGNNSGTLDHRAALADLIIYLDMPTYLRLWRFTKRAFIYRGRSRPDMAEGCNERWDPVFVYRFILRYGPRRLQALARLQGWRDKGYRVVHLSSRRAVAQWLADLRAGRYEAGHD